MLKQHRRRLPSENKPMQDVENADFANKDIKEEVEQRLHEWRGSHPKHALAPLPLLNPASRVRHFTREAALERFVEHM